MNVCQKSEKLFPLGNAMSSQILILPIQLQNGKELEIINEAHDLFFQFFWRNS